MRLPFTNISLRPLALCVYACVFLCSIVSVSSSLSKCQSNLLLFPDHAVGDRPTSSPWQPSVLAQRKRLGWKKKGTFMPLNPH